MGKFVVVYHSSISAAEQMKDATPEVRWTPKFGQVAKRESRS